MEIKPITGINAMVSAPGSKSYTQRALIIAALAQGNSTLHNALLSEDTAYVMDALKALGAEIATQGTDMVIKGTAGHLKDPGEAIYLGNNGTAMRLLTGIAALGTGTVTLTGSPRLCERPIKPLLITALQSIGVDARGRGTNGLPPVIVHAHRPRGGYRHPRGYREQSIHLRPAPLRPLCRERYHHRAPGGNPVSSLCRDDRRGDGGLWGNGAATSAPSGMW